MSSGDNSDGQLGLGHFENVNTFQIVSKDPKINSISCGGNHSAYLTSKIKISNKNNKKKKNKF